MIHAADGWYDVTYRWNAAGTDAELLFDGQSQPLTLTDAAGKTTSRNWTYPSRTQCMTCHNPVSGGSLGLMTRQLNKAHFYPVTGRTANQLETLSALGIFQTPIAPTAIPNLPTLKPASDSAATLAQRARSYLDSNCAYCHQPGGVRASFDARYTTPLENTAILNGSLAESLGIPGAAVISPGSIAKSIIHHRASSVGEGHSMPPLAKGAVDTEGVALLADWIYSLAPAAGNGTTTLGNSTATSGNFSDAHHPSLYVNKTDTFTNNTSSAVTFSPVNFNFHATKKGNPVTPFAAIVSGSNSFAIGTTGNLARVKTATTGKNGWVKYEGDYLVPAGQTRTRFVLVPISDASSLIAANFIDNVSVIQSTTQNPPPPETTGISNASF